MDDVIFGHHGHVMIYACGIERIDVIHLYCLNLTSRRDYYGPYNAYVVVFSYDHYRYGVDGSHLSLNVGDDVFVSDYHRQRGILPHPCLG